MSPLSLSTNYQIDFVYEGINIPHCTFFTNGINSPYSLFATVSNNIYVRSTSGGGSWTYYQPINSQSGINTLSIVKLNDIESIYLNGVRIHRELITTSYTLLGNLIVLGKYPKYGGYIDPNQYNIKGLRIYTGPNVYPDVDNVTVPSLPLTAI
jgi:hypothetical protein